MFDMLAVAQQLAGRRRRSANRPKTGAGDSRGLRPARFCQEQTRVLCGVSRLASCGGNQGFYAGFPAHRSAAGGHPQRRGRGRETPSAAAARGRRDAAIVALAVCAGLRSVRDLGTQTADLPGVRG